VFTQQLKVVSAAVGVVATIVLSALGVATSTVVSAQRGPFAPEATLGQTITATTPPSEVPVAQATPALKGPAPLPPEEQGLPG
jgi:hypothetical protein